MSFIARNGRPFGERADVVNWGDARVLKPAGYLGLADESPGRGRIGRDVITQELDGDIATQGAVTGTVNDPHAAATDLGEQFVTWRVLRRGRNG